MGSWFRHILGMELTTYTGFSPNGVEATGSFTGPRDGSVLHFSRPGTEKREHSGNPVSPRQQSCYRICSLSRNHGRYSVTKSTYFTWISGEIPGILSARVWMCWGGLSSPPQSLRCALPKCVISLHDRFSIPSTYLLALLLALSQFFVSFLSPPASPALGQASECQQSLPNVGTGECFWSGPPAPGFLSSTVLTKLFLIMVKRCAGRDLRLNFAEITNLNYFD